MSQPGVYPTVWQVASVGPRARGYWGRYLLVLLLLLPVDYATTKIAVSTYGLEVELNPVMRWVLRQPLVIEVAVHIGVLSVAVLGFGLLLEAIEREPVPGHLATAVDAWLWGWLIVGASVCLSNVGFLVASVYHADPSAVPHVLPA